jgi:hypothetical protein
MGLRRTIRATLPPMTYILRIGPWHIGPFSTHTAASHYAECHGCDDYTMIPMDDPAEAPRMIHRLRMGELTHPMKKAPVAQAGA